MIKRFDWVLENGEWTLYRFRKDNGHELLYPRSTGYYIRTLGSTVILTFSDGGTGTYNSIAEAKIEAEKEVCHYATS